MIENNQAKRIVIISDNEGVAQIVQFTVGREVEMPTMLINFPIHDAPPFDLNHCALIILALSSVASEPVIALARASLLRYVGCVPLLIISERPFVSDQPTQIHHMDFPFTASELKSQVRQIVSEVKRKPPCDQPPSVFQ